MPIGVITENLYYLQWSAKNNVADIETWKLYEEDGNVWKEGKGLKEFINVDFGDKQTYIYVRELSFFQVILGSVVDYTNYEYFKDYCGGGTGGLFFLKLRDKVELRNADNFDFKTETPQDWLKCFKRERKALKPRKNKNPLRLKEHFKYTLARERWQWLVGSYYLIRPTNYAQVYRKKVMPQNEEEMDIYLNRTNKSSFLYVNDDYLGKIVENPVEYDIRSSHFSFLIRNDYPVGRGFVVKNKEEIIDIIKNKTHCWMLRTVVEGLDWKTKFKFDMEIGEPGWAEAISDGKWRITLLDADWYWFNTLFKYDNLEITYFVKYVKEKVHKDIARIAELYDMKEEAKKTDDDYIKNFTKDITELPYGQPMKRIQYDCSFRVDPKQNEFYPEPCYEELTYEEKLAKMRNVYRGLPYIWSLWTAAYSRNEWCKIASQIGFENIIYGDTDSVFVVQEKALDAERIIFKRNEELKEEAKRLTYSERRVRVNPKLGQWEHKPDIKRMKVLGKKWYLLDRVFEEMKITCAGADKKVLTNFIKSYDDCMHAFIYAELKKVNLFKFMDKGRVPHSIVCCMVGFNDSELKFINNKQKYTHLGFKELLKED